MPPPDTPPAEYRRPTAAHKIWRAVTEPLVSIPDPDARHQAQLLAALLLFLQIISLIALLLALLRPDTNSRTQPLALISVMVMLAGYLLSRSARFHWGAVLVVIAASLLPLIGALDPRASDSLRGATFLIFPTLLSSMILSRPFTLALIALQLIGLLLLPGLHPTARITPDVSLSAAAVHLLSSAVIVLCTSYRQIIERRRYDDLRRRETELQADYDRLEARISERTAELSELNARLRQQIAEREQAEQALTQERNLLRTLIEHLPDPIFVKDTQHRFLMVNSAALRRLKAARPEDVLGKSDLDFFPEEEARAYTADEAGIFTTGEPIINAQCQYLDENNAPRWLLGMKIPLRDTEGRIVGLVGIDRDITELKQAEDALVKERNLLRTLVENLPDMVFVLDRDSRYVLDNAAHRRIIGAASAADVIGRSAEDFFPAQQAALFRAEEQQIMASGQPVFNVEEGYTDRVTGLITYHLLSKIPLRDTSGAIIGLIGISRSITELKQAQLALQQVNSSLERRVEIRTLELFKANMRLKAEIEERERAEAAERQQRLLAEALRDTAAAINTLEPDEVLDRIFTYVARIVPCDSASISLIEDGIARVVRYWSSEPARLSREILTAGFRVDETPTLRRMRDTGQPLLVENTQTYPGWVVVSSTSRFGSYIGAPIRIDGVVIGFMNVNTYQPYKLKPEHVERMAVFTEQVAVAIRNARLYEAARRSADELAERVIERTAELEEQRAQLEAILDSITDGVVSTRITETNELEPIYINHAFEQMLGYSLADWYPRLTRDVIVSDDHNTPEQLYQQALADLLQQGRWSGEVMLRRRDGSIFDAYVETVRISSGERMFSGVVTVVRDISQQKALEEQKSRFVASASHELRTPITNLITRLWLLRRQPEKLDEHLDILDDVANRIRRLVIDLLDLSRFERGQIPLQREAMDIVPVIQSVVSLQRPEAERKHVRLLADLPEKPLIVLGDSERIHQVITNLVTNAIHYTPEGGQVQVYTTGPLHPDEKLIAIHVEDSGIGIAPEHVPNLFQPFYRAGAQHSGGTGLGLTIAREIVLQHGGDIHVQSEPGIGSTFTVRLPLIK